MFTKSRLIDLVDEFRRCITDKELEELGVLDRIIDEIEDEFILACYLINKVEEDRKQNPKLYFEDKYRKELESYSSNRLPEHKIQWYLEAIDTMVRLFKFAPLEGVKRQTVDLVIKFSGIFERRFVEPELQTIYDNPSNWKSEKGYQGQINRYYIGPNEAFVAVREHNSFKKEDYRYLFVTLIEERVLVESDGYRLKLGKMV